jgi:hypothetical protein
MGILECWNIGRMGLINSSIGIGQKLIEGKDKNR